MPDINSLDQILQLSLIPRPKLFPVNVRVNAIATLRHQNNYTNTYAYFLIHSFVYATMSQISY